MLLRVITEGEGGGEKEVSGLRDSSGGNGNSKWGGGGLGWSEKLKEINREK